MCPRGTPNLRFSPAPGPALRPSRFLLLFGSEKLKKRLPIWAHAKGFRSGDPLNYQSHQQIPLHYTSRLPYTHHIYKFNQAKCCKMLFQYRTAGKGEANPLACIVDTAMNISVLLPIYLMEVSCNEWNKGILCTRFPFTPYSGIPLLGNCYYASDGFCWHFERCENLYWKMVLLWSFFFILYEVRPPGWWIWVMLFIAWEGLSARSWVQPHLAAPSFWSSFNYINGFNRSIIVVAEPHSSHLKFSIRKMRQLNVKLRVRAAMKMQD